MQIFKKKNPIEYIIYWAVMTSVVALDMITKFLSYALLSKVETVPIIKGVIHFTYVENRGAAFGMLKDHRWVFISISVIVIAAFLAYLFLGHAESRLMGVALSLVTAGGLGNMIDRLALGYVVDFIDFRLINFAVFNVADSCVCIGAGLLVLYLILEIKKEVKQKNGN
ncbi:MAG: signal peptidase II [Clostridia bacterium]|nr:signal peptidase II [Clostridia bacterium]